MTRGQESLVMDLEAPASSYASAIQIDVSVLTVVRATAEEILAHETMLDAIDRAAAGGSVWRRTLGVAA